MKYLILFFFLSCTTLINAQNLNNDTQIYSHKYMYIKAFDEDKLYFIKPYGREVTIRFDKFLKTFNITFFDTDNKEKAINLSYIGKAKYNLWLMEDKFKNKFYVNNLLETNDFGDNKLELANYEKIRDTNFIIYVTDILHEE